MNHSVYNTCSEDAILRYMGPYKMISGDESIVGNIVPEEIIVGAPLLIGETIIYGEAVIIKEISDFSE